jgi:hypothetical protein
MILGPVLKTNCNQRPLVDKYHSLFVPLTDWNNKFTSE